MCGRNVDSVLDAEGFYTLTYESFFRNTTCSAGSPLNPLSARNTSVTLQDLG